MHGDVEDLLFFLLITTQSQGLG